MLPQSICIAWSGRSAAGNHSETLPACSFRSASANFLRNSSVVVSAGLWTLIVVK